VQHNLVFNHLSLPAEDKEIAYKLFLDSLKGMLSVGEDSDRYAIFSDAGSDFSKVELASGYNFEDFRNDLQERGEEDMNLVLFEVEDKTPMLDHIPDALIEVIAESCFYFPDQPYTTTVDILGIAWHLNATLLSLGTAEIWRQAEVNFAEFSDNPLNGSTLPNISCKEHGVAIRTRRLAIEVGTLQVQFLDCQFSQPFLAWNESISKPLQARVREKIRLAVDKKFAGGKPLFETLSDAGGIRELRFSNIDGGAVRILFKTISGGKVGILSGFIKKSNSEGYAESIPIAVAELKKM